MKLYYTFVENCNEYDFEFEVDYSDVVDLIRDDLDADGVDIEDDEAVNEYIEMAMDDIKEHFYDAAYDEWRDCHEYEKDPWGYYGFSIHDFI